MKLSNESSINNYKKKNDSSAANSTDLGIESGYISKVDFTNSTEADFSLPPVKRKRLVRSQVSFSQNKKPFNLTDPQQTSLGYSSLLSSSSLFSPRKSSNRTPKKRKLDDTESDENVFYNSYQFVSPLKISTQSLGNSAKRAKLILKEKSSSENVILSSTPIRNSNKNKLWGKFRSLHHENFEIGRSLDAAAKPPFLPKSTEVSFDCGSSFDLTNSFDQTNNADQQDNNIPHNYHQLWTGSIIPVTCAKPQAVAEISKPIETATKSQEQNLSSASSRLSFRRFFCGRSKLDICGKLHMEHNIALKKVLTHLSDIDLLSLSHVSKEYRHMIISNKTWETKRKNYLKEHQKIKENEFPRFCTNTLAKSTVPKEQKKAFGESNINHTMELRARQPSPPVSPSRKRFHENQKVSSSFIAPSSSTCNHQSCFQIAQSHSGPIKKCPRCSRPATISSIKIRSSPRKRKKSSNVLKICSFNSGRVQKQSKTFLSKPSIDSHSQIDQLYATFPTLDDHSGSTSASSSCASPTSPSSDESSNSENESMEVVYEFAVCSGYACHFKFCSKCNCKYHPRQTCKDLSPASPSREHFNKSSVACSSKSFKSLKRLFKV